MTSSYSNIESEYLDINNRKAWPHFFQLIRAESMKFDYKCLEAKKPQNKNLNRYRDVNPYDHTRIILSRGSCDYINANLVKVEKANRRYILTQGPLAETVGHFWLMVWEQKSKAILMLNKLVENRQVKCHCYWPEVIGPDHIMYFNDIGLKLEYLSFKDESYYVKRHFKLIDMETDTSREIIQFHYTTWPDFGVPTSPTAFLDFLKVVRESGALENNVGPAVVHCSAGIGRSGTFCLVDSCLILIEKYGINSIDVKEVLMEMRRSRMGLIQTPDQLRFSYQAIIEGAKQLVNPNSESSNEDKPENNVERVYDEVIHDEDNEDDDGDDDDNEPPPLPPPRGESLSRSTFDNKPLPTIPISVSMNDIDEQERSADIINSNVTTENNRPMEPLLNGPPNRPLPGVPQSEQENSSSDEEDELEPEDESQPIDTVVERHDEDKMTSSLLKQRKRVERQEKLAEKVQEIKRKQRASESWENVKRSLYRPITIGLCVVCILGGGALIYAYYKGPKLTKKSKDENSEEK